MKHGRLTPLQDEVLEVFFASEREFFLSGGGALVGFHLRHRETTDLDLFTVSSDAFERARIVLPNIVDAMGAEWTIRQDAPGFRRVVIIKGSDDLVVDLVRDIGPQLHQKSEIDGIVIDPVEEIFSNKLTTLVSRQEVRDLIDVMEIERRGLRVEDFLKEANHKDGGCTPAVLAYLLRDWHLADNLVMPSGYSVEELRAFKNSLIDRLLRAAFPT